MEGPVAGIFHPFSLLIIPIDVKRKKKKNSKHIGAGVAATESIRLDQAWMKLSDERLALDAASGKITLLRPVRSDSANPLVGEQLESRGGFEPGTGSFIYHANTRSASPEEVRSPLSHQVCRGHRGRGSTLEEGPGNR